MTERALRSSIEHLHGPEEVPYGEDELVVVCLVRDGRPYVKSFVEHYFALGVKHIFFLDNGSTDGTIEALKNYDNVTVLRTELSYKGYKDLMKRYLVGRFGKENRWCLKADVDELFDYPYSDIVSLGSFLRYLTRKSYTAVAAQMLDMFPEEPLSSRASNLEDEPLKECHRFYDLSNISRMSIEEYPVPRDNTYESDEFEVFSGGIRKTALGAPPHWKKGPLLTKIPLAFSDGRVTRFDSSSHWADNARIADITCVLFHYKFLDGYFQERTAQVVREEQYWNNSAIYKKYLEVLDKNPTLQLKRETARELKSVNDLVENGFLVVSEEYMMVVYDEEERKGGGHTLQAELGDEAAFYGAKAQAKVQGLRAQRLKRHLEELEEQNRREVEEVSSRLAKVRKKNQNLTHRLQSIQASRTWKVAKMLRRIKVRVLSLRRALS